ncbi:helix-turn-helix domain-containing protein [Arthrobacter sp. NPDC090010]|uniref:helix-turn-helix domain-containing protein n=1 Tax=Arthrobacter sp. NPDC090010 TaxID=3363942 RepID=UPI00381BE4D4
MADHEKEDPGELHRLLGSVGPRLRALREARGLTLETLSADTGISLSTLSRLESGIRRPSLELLYPLAKHYRLPLDELVGAPAVGDPRVHIKPIHEPGRTMLPLSRGENGMYVYKHVLHGAAAPAEPMTRVHPGHEWLYVIAGELRLVLGREEYRLAPGEAAEFDTTTPHWFGPAGARATEFLGIFSAAGERVHVSEFLD